MADRGGRLPDSCGRRAIYWTFLDAALSRSALQIAGVVKLADAPDSKSGGVYPP